MCLAIPGKIVRIDPDTKPRMGLVEFGGVGKNVCLELLPEAVQGDYVIVHVGFAISVLDQQEAVSTLALIDHVPESDGDEIPG